MVCETIYSNWLSVYHRSNASNSIWTNRRCSRVVGPWHTILMRDAIVDAGTAQLMNWIGGAEVAAVAANAAAVAVAIADDDGDDVDFGIPSIW